jgi:hypothetical protein
MTPKNKEQSEKGAGMTPEKEIKRNGGSDDTKEQRKE